MRLAVPAERSSNARAISDLGATPTFEKRVPRLLLVVRRPPTARKRVWGAEGAPVSLAFLGEKKAPLGLRARYRTKRNGTVQERKETL